jgi:hypothetical protein
MTKPAEKALRKVWWGAFDGDDTCQPIVKAWQAAAAKKQQQPTCVLQDHEAMHEWMELGGQSDGKWTMSQEDLTKILDIGSKVRVEWEKYNRRERISNFIMYLRYSSPLQPFIEPILISMCQSPGGWYCVSENSGLAYFVVHTEPVM